MSKQQIRQLGQCSIDGCTSNARARGWCSKHYSRWSRNGNFDPPKRVIGCKVSGCNEKHEARGYCHRHYQQSKYGIVPKVFVDCLHCGLSIKANSYNTKLHPECVKPRLDDQRYRKKFGISLAEYEALLIKQDSACAICKEPQRKKLAVDHDHQSGAVRGLLCGSCNRGIGLLRDNTCILRNAIDYLHAYSERS